MSPSSLTTSTPRRLPKSSSWEESGDKDTLPSYLCDAELDDETIGKALSSPLLIQEREEPADRRQALSLLRRKFVANSVIFRPLKNGERPVRELSSLSSCSREKSSREMENETIRILFRRQKEQILADFRAEIRKHEFQADSDRRSIQELQNEVNCLNDESRDFKDAESVRSGLCHVPSHPALLPPFSRSWRNAKLFCGNAEPQR